jgi:hypothetical protein
MKIVKKKRVWHVGDIARSRRRTSWSMEGSGLSVSEHPSAWREIARLGGGKLFAMERLGGKHGRFVDLTSPGPALLKLAVSRGLLEPTIVWRVTSFDDELDSETWADYASEEMARAEIDEDGDGPEPIKSFIAAPALAKRWKIDFTSAIDPVGQGTIEIGILYALEDTQVELDGAWWRERLDPSVYSAPRGVIFQSRLPRWVATEIPWAEAPDADEEY